VTGGTACCSPLFRYWRTILDLNLALEPLLKAGGMKVRHQEEMLGPGTFEVYLVQKTG